MLATVEAGLVPGLHVRGLENTAPAIEVRAVVDGNRDYFRSWQMPFWKLSKFWTESSAYGSTVWEIIVKLSLNNHLYNIKV